MINTNSPHKNFYGFQKWNRYNLLMRYLYTIRKKEFILGFSKGIFLALALYRYDALCRKSIGLKLFVNICSKVY